MSDAAPSESPLGGFLRPFWMLIGNALILLVALAIARMPPWTPSWRDGMFGLAVVALVWSRWTDVTRHGGTTADGEPMTRSMLLRWMAGAAVVSGALWLLVQSVEF